MNSEDLRRVHQQFSAAEVPGFAARTVIDDTIGKLYALRTRLAVDIPDELSGVLDDIEALTERAISLAYDENAERVENGVYRPDLPEPLKRATAPDVSQTAAQVSSACVPAVCRFSPDARS